MQKINFLLEKKLKSTESAQLWTFCSIQVSATEAELGRFPFTALPSTGLSAKETLNKACRVVYTDASFNEFN